MSKNGEDKAVDILSNLDDSFANADGRIERAVILDPSASIEASLSDFVRDSFKAVAKKRARGEEVWEALRQRMGEAKYSELLTLYEIENNAESDMTSKLITPFAEVTSAKIAASGTVEKQVVNQVYEEANKEVLQGLTTLFGMLNSMKKDKEKEKKED